MAITIACSSSPIHSPPPLFSVPSPSSSSTKSLQSLPQATISVSPPSFAVVPPPPCYKLGVNLVVSSNEALPGTDNIATATVAEAVARRAVRAAKEAVTLDSVSRGELCFDGESRNGLGEGHDDDDDDDDGCNDLMARRKKRRRRRKGFECLEAEEEERDGGFRGVLSELAKKNGYLSSKEEAECCLFLKDQARLEAARRRIAQAQGHETTSKQLAKALKIKKRNVDKIVCRGRESMQRLTSSYRRLVVSIAIGYQGKGLSLEDLVQAGSIGLLRGAVKFEPERGYKLSTYAYWWIKEAIITALRRKSRITRLPGSAWEMVTKIARANNGLRERLRRLPSWDEIAEELNVEVSKVRLALERSRFSVSLDQTVTEQGSMTLLEITPGPDELMPERMVEKQLMKRDLKMLIQKLTEREAHILRLRFGLSGQTPRSCEEIGRLLNLSRERVRQINVNALSKLRNSCTVENMKVYIM